jgi:protein ImuB
MFARKPKRDLGAARRAIARLRAALGDRAVVRAALRDGHLPEARFEWQPLDGVGEPHPRDVPLRPLIRRIEPRPVPLPPRAPREPDGWLLRGVDHGPVTRFVGPFVMSGGWWHHEIARDYYFGELRSGALYWFYYDRRRRRWFLQGQVS